MDEEIYKHAVVGQFDIFAPVDEQGLKDALFRAGAELARRRDAQILAAIETGAVVEPKPEPSK